MAVKNDVWIRDMAVKHEMIQPFNPQQVSSGVISSGVSSYGYDIRLADEFKIFAADHHIVLDPKNVNKEIFADYQGPTCVIPPKSYVLARSLEYFKIPRDILTICFGKSSYARCGVVVNVTPFEPEWEGYATICLINTAPVPVKVYAHEGIAQLIFLTAHEVCQTSYKDKKGKYQAQQEITLPKL